MDVPTAPAIPQLPPNITIISQPPPKKPILNLSWLKKPLLIFGSLALVGMVGLASLQLLQNRKTPLVLQPTSPKLLPQSRIISQQITKAFGNQPSYKSVVDYINLAVNEKDQTKKYEYYKKAFDKGLAAYNQEKKPGMKLALYQIKDYMVTFPSFQASDFTLPE